MMLKQIPTCFPVTAYDRHKALGQICQIMITRFRPRAVALVDNLAGAPVRDCGPVNGTLVTIVNLALFPDARLKSQDS